MCWIGSAWTRDGVGRFRGAIPTGACSNLPTVRTSDRGGRYKILHSEGLRLQTVTANVEAATIADSSATRVRVFVAAGNFRGQFAAYTGTPPQPARSIVGHSALAEWHFSGLYIASTSAHLRALRPLAFCAIGA